MGATKSQNAYNKSQLRNTHPFQQKSVLVEQGNKRYIQSSFRMNENHYNHWRSGVESVAHSPYNQFLYVPQDMGYVKNDKLCGSSAGYAVVIFISFRSTTPSTPFCFLTRLVVGGSRTTTSKRRIFTICSILQLLPNMTQISEKRLQEISSLKMSLSTKIKWFTHKRESIIIMII